MAKIIDVKKIEAKYDEAGYRFSQEKNDFLLPQVIDFVLKEKWINLRPEYQRRLVWDKTKKSLFLESLLMNVPVPPIFLYEWEYSRYEVMDGQQRLNTIVEFYGGNFKLSGLEYWPELNGLFYKDCPPKIRSGFDRRRISAIVLLAESGSQDKTFKNQIRKVVFERLNTGGRPLRAQEIRNCIYGGLFSESIIKLAGNRLFDQIWEIPPYEDNIKKNHISVSLAENNYFRRMEDCEIVLRFFAFKKKASIKGSVKKILDSCMEEMMTANRSTIDSMEKNFIEILTLAHDIFGPETFRIKEGTERKLSKPLFDAVMIALDRLYANKNAITAKKKAIREALNAKLSNSKFHELIIGKANTADSIKKRLDSVEKIFKNEI